MKKLFCLFLVLALVPTALAEEALQTTDQLTLPSYFPCVYFGADPETAIQYFNAGWERGGSYSKEPVNEEVTLSNGATFQVMTFPAVASEAGGSGSAPMTMKLYFQKGVLFAAVQQVEIPEGMDASTTIEFVNNNLKSAEKGALNLEEQDAVCVELLEKDAHLKNGQQTWKYKLSTDGITVLNTAILTILEEDGHIYLAEFPVENSAETQQSSVGALNLVELKGFGELSDAQKNAVILYANFLQKQQMEELEKYIDFLKNNQ